MIKVCIIGAWFGSFPNWIDLWIESVRYNPTIDYLVVTDQKIGDNTPTNLRFLKTTLFGLKQQAEEKLKMKIRLESAYKLCDYKPLYGKIFENEIHDYDYWGECDFDLLFGDVRKFIDQNDIQKYDKFLNRGHLTLYRNNEEVINRYKLRGGDFGTYQEIFRSDMVWGLDEMYGINRIYQKNRFPSFNQCIFADIDRKYPDFRLSASYFRQGERFNYSKQIFCWRKGTVYQEYVANDSSIQLKEFMYIHFAKRKFDKPEKSIIKDGQFCITPYGFVPYPREMTGDFMERYNRIDNTKANIRKDHTPKIDKKLKFFWLGRRYLNAKYRFKHNNKRTGKRN